MRNTHVAVLLIAMISAAAVGDRFLAQTNDGQEQERDYPRPRYAEFVTDLSQEQLMYLARQQARQTESRNGRLGVIEPGKKGLITLNERQDMDIIHAVIQGLRERGADADYIYTVDLLEKYGYPRYYAEPDYRPDLITEAPMEMLLRGIEKYSLKQENFTAAAWDELPPGGREILEETRKRYHVRNAVLKSYLDEHPEYDYVFIDWFSGGPHIQEMTRLYGRKFHLGWRIPNKAKLVEEGSIPKEVWRALEQKVLDVIPWIRHVRVTDPEGTDVEFSISSEDAAIWRRSAFLVDYMRLYPLQAGRWVYRNFGLKKIIVPKTNGIIAGTNGNDGIVIPHLKLTIEDGLVVKVEGGGIQGFLMENIREKYKDAHLPYFPRPGWLWVFQMSTAVNPKGSRSMSWAFGPELYMPEILEYSERHNVPVTHDFHFGQRFATYEATVTGGRKVRIRDKGHLVALDDPEVRAIASKYGDPDDILREESAVPIPGINAPGDYWEDYANDTVAYWLNQREERNSGRSPYLVKVLSLQLRNFEDR